MVDVGHGDWASQSVTYDAHSRQVSLFPFEFLLRVSGPNPIVIPSYMFIFLTDFLPVSIQFSVRTVPRVHVFFCLCREVSSMSSYSAILIQSPNLSISYY